MYLLPTGKISDLHPVFPQNLRLTILSVSYDLLYRIALDSNLQEKMSSFSFSMSLFWPQGSPLILPKGFPCFQCAWWSLIPVISPRFQHLPAVSGKRIVNYKLMIFRSTSLSFSTHTGRFAFVCNHCSLRSAGRRVIIITAILPMGNRDPEAGVPWQRPTVTQQRAGLQETGRWPSLSRASACAVFGREVHSHERTTLCSLHCQMFK